MDASSAHRLYKLEKKAELEARNALNQIDYLTYLLNLGTRELREHDIKELKALAVEGIYDCGGEYRSALFGLKISDTPHSPPEPALVPLLVQELVNWCNDKRYSTLARAAYALWRLNWIHPFSGGNGRTARAIAYLIIAMDLGAMPPGMPSLPMLIAEPARRISACSSGM